MDRQQFLAMVDHTLLNSEATVQQVEEVCDEAVGLGTATVCVNGLWARYISRRLQGTRVQPCVVVGFPLGAMSPVAVAGEAAEAITDGAVELDMVMPVGLLRSGESKAVGAYITGVRRECEGRTLKVILETALLTQTEIGIACRIAVDAGADFVKTSTGFNVAGGASIEAVRCMREHVGPGFGVKASGGIRTLEQAMRMITAGATRLGMSATRSVADELLALPQG